MEKVKIISRPSLMNKIFIRKKRETEKLAAEKLAFKPVKKRKVNILAIQQRIAEILKDIKHAVPTSK
jgi:hypothetical protein